MPDISLTFQFHQPRIPQEFRFERHQGKANDEEAGRKSLKAMVDQVISPFVTMYNRSGKSAPGLGLAVSGTLLDQLTLWEEESLKALQEIWQRSEVEILPQPYQRTAGVVHNREEWVRDIQQYRERISLLGGTLSPVLVNPGYLFISYLAWPLQELGIGAVMVDGDGFGWSGKWANRISRVSFQHSFKVLTRNSGWSRRLETLEGMEQGPIQLANQWLEELSSVGNEPVALAIDARKWLSRPALIEDAMTLLYMLFTRAADYNIRWVSPGTLLQNHSVTADFDPSDWVVSPEARALLGNRDDYPVSAEVQSVWNELRQSSANPDPLFLDEAWLSVVDSPYSRVPGTNLTAGHIFARMMGVFAHMKQGVNG